MPKVTLKHVFPATYIQAPVSAVFPRSPDFIGAHGKLAILKVEYGSNESRTRQICVFVGEANFHTDPGLVSQDGDVITHAHRFTPKDGILREPLRDDLAGEYVNAWRLDGPEIRDPQVREDMLETIKTRWRVLRRAEMG